MDGGSRAPMEPCEGEGRRRRERKPGGRREPKGSSRVGSTQAKRKEGRVLGEKKGEGVTWEGDPIPGAGGRRRRSNAIFRWRCQTRSP